VTVRCATAGATIRYATNGSEPTASDRIIASGSALNVAGTTFLRAKAFKTGYSTSNTKSGVYQIGGSVVSSLNHTLAIKRDGTLWAWGSNDRGQLGVGSTVDQWFPAQVGGLSDVAAAAGGIYHSVAAKADGTVWAWGYDDATDYPGASERVNERGGGNGWGFAQRGIEERRNGVGMGK